TLWNVVYDKETDRWYAHAGSRLYDMAYSQRDHLLLSAAKHSTARIRNLNELALYRVIWGHFERVYGTAVCPSTGRIATASKDGTVKVWRPSNSSFSKRLLRSGIESHAARFARNGNVLLETANWDQGHVVRHDLVSASQEKWRAFLSGAGN